MYEGRFVPRRSFRVNIKQIISRIKERREGEFVLSAGSRVADEWRAWASLTSGER